MSMRLTVAWATGIVVALTAVSGFAQDAGPPADDAEAPGETEIREVTPAGPAEPAAEASPSDSPPADPDSRETDEPTKAPPAGEGDAETLEVREVTTVPEEADEEVTGDAADVRDLDLEALLDTRFERLTAPGIGHTHKAGEVMFGYKFAFVSMGSNYAGSSKLTAEEIVRDGGDFGFMAAPTGMDMEMHMLRLMYAPHDRLTLMLMVPYMRMSMDHITRPGAEFITESEGLGDVVLSGLVPFLLEGMHRLHVTAGISFPTGSIDERDDIPMMDDARLPYPMQIGSGTFDLRPAITYRGLWERLSWGLKIQGVARLGHNDNGYRRGHRLQASAWGSMEFAEWFSTFVLVDAHHWGDVDGADPQLDPSMVQTADPSLQGGTRLDGSIIVALDGTERLEGLRVEGALGMPLYQNLDGPQLGVSFFASFSVLYVFDTHD